MYPEIPILSFVSAALNLVPVIWYLYARNIAAAAIGIWLSVMNVTYAVDALIWAEDADIKALVWCDISTSLVTCSRIALPAACLCICVHLECLVSFCQNFKPQAKWRRIMFECLMCFGSPVVYTASHLVVQPRRFDLSYGFGCRPATYPSIATVFLVTIPPLLLTAVTIVCAGIAWRHSIVHGVQFCGKRGSISSLTRNLYLRLVVMALLEAGLSAVLVVVATWGVLSLGLAPIGNMSRDLSEVLVRGPEAITDTIRTALWIEWSVTVVQSMAFLGLFACRMEVVCKGLELVRSFLRLLKRRNVSVTLGKDILERSSANITVPTLPLTEVDLSVVIQSASTLTPYSQAMGKSLPLMTSHSRPPSLVEDASEEAVISAIAPSMVPLESPSRASAIASSHNSLASNFDPNWLVLSPDACPRTPTWTPAHLPCRSFDVGYDPERFGESWLDMDIPLARVKVAEQVRWYSVGLYSKFSVREPEKRHAIHPT